MIDAIFVPPSDKMIIPCHYYNVNMIVINISKKSHYSTKKYCGLIDYQSHSAYIYLIIFPHPVKSNQKWSVYSTIYCRRRAIFMVEKILENVINEMIPHLDDGQLDAPGAVQYSRYGKCRYAI